MPKKLTQEEIINRAKQVHGEKYEYTKEALWLFEDEEDLKNFFNVFKTL